MVRFPGKARDLFSCAVSRPELGTVKTRAEWVTWASFPGVKRPSCEAQLHPLPTRGVSEPATPLIDVSSWREHEELCLMREKLPTVNDII